MLAARACLGAGRRLGEENGVKHDQGGKAEDETKDDHESRRTIVSGDRDVHARLAMRSRGDGMRYA